MQTIQAYLALVSLLSGVATVLAANATCNGDATLCSKLYSNVTFLGAHNSYAVGTSVSDNQHYSVTTQLNNGIRLLQGQVSDQRPYEEIWILICIGA